MERAISKQTLTRVSHPHSSSVTATSTTITTSVTTSPRDAPQTSVPSNKCGNKSSGRSSTNRIAAATASKTEEERWKSRTPAAAPRATAPTTASAAAALQNVGGTHGIGHQTRRIRHHISSQKNYTNKDRNKGYDDNNDYCGDDADDRQTKLAAAGSYVVETNSFPQYALGNGFATNYCDTEKSVVNGEPSYIATRPAAAAVTPAVMTHEEDQLQLVHRFKELRRQQIQQQEILMQQQKQQLLLLRQEMEQRQKIMANIHTDGAPAGLIRYHVNAETPPRIQLHNPAPPSAPCLSSKGDFISSSEDESLPDTEQGLDGFHALPEDGGSDKGLTGHLSQMNSPRRGNGNYTDQNNAIHRGEETSPLCDGNSECYDEARCLKDTPALATTSNDLERLRPVNVNSGNLEDERPITSKIGRVKTFQQLLEEELQKENSTPTLLLANPKRNFLRRGEGIARFHPPANKKSIQRHTERSSSRSKSVSVPQRAVPRMLKKQSVPKRPTSQPVLLRNKLKETKVDLEITQCKPPIYPPPVNRRRSKSAAAKPMSSSSLSSQYSNTLSQKPQSTTTTTTMVIMTSLASSSHGSISSSQTTRSVPSVSVPFSHSSKTQVPTTSANIIQDGGSGNGESNEINKNAQFFEDTGAAAIPANAEDVERILKAIYEGQPLPQDSEEVEEAAGKGSTTLNETLSNSVEVETKDLAEFEFMEQLADDMSFCSDSSVVVKFMDKRLPCSVSKLKDVHASPSSLPASWGSRNSVPCHRSSITSFNSAISSDREDTLVNGVTDSSSDTSETLFSSSERCSEVDVADIGTDGVEGDDGGCGDKMFWTEEEVKNDGYVKKNDSNRQIDYNDGDTQYNDVDTQINEVVEYQESDGEDRCVDLGQSAEATMMGFGAMSKTGTVQNKIDTLFLDSSPKSRRDQDRGQRSPQQREVVGTAGETRSAMVSATLEPGAAAVCRQHWHRIHANGNRDSYANPGSQIAGHSEVKVVPLSARGITRKIAVKEGGSWQPVRGGYINKSVGTEVEQECVVGTNATTSVTFGARGGGSERFGSGVENEQDEDEEGGGSARSSNFCSSDECMTDDDAAAVGRTLGTDTVNGSNLGGRCIDIRGGFAADARGRSTASASDASPLPSDEEGSGGENADDDNRNNNDDDDSDDDCSDDDEDAWNDTCDSVKKIEESLFQKSLSQKQDPPTVVLKTNSAIGKSSSPSSPSSSVSTPPTSTLISKLFPALQLRPQDNTKDEKQSLSQATKVPIREASQSHLLREKLAQLEKEITRFQKENTHLEKLRLEREESVKKLREEIAKFDLVKKNEIQKLEEFKEQELKKIKNEKKLFEKYKKAVRSLPSKQDRQEIETLKSHLKDLQEEMKRKESRWNANNNRLRQRIQELEDETHQLKDEIHFMEKKRLEWIKEKEAMNQAKRKSIQPISQTPNLSLSTLNSSCDSQTEDEAILEHVEVIRNGMLPSSMKSDHHSGRQRQQQGLNQQQQQASDSSSNKPLRSSSEALPRRPNVTSAAPQDLTVASKLNFNRNNLLHEDEGEEDEREERKKNKKNGNRNKTKRISLKHPGILKGNVLEKIHHSDGKAEKVYQNGARELIFSNGTRKEMSADGKHIALHFFNGDIKQITADQTVIYFYAESETMVTTYPDGLEVLDFPTGQIEKHFPNGTQQITFPDQTVKYLHEDGSEESHCLDGTVIKVESNGIRTLHFPNGQREIHTDKFKRREYPDGTRKTIYPDGRQETKFANGHVRIKDRDGNVLLDKKL